MKLYIGVCGLLFIQVALAVKVVNINSPVDRYFNIVNHFLSENGAGLKALSPYSNDEVQLSEGFMVGADSLYRIGNANVIMSDDHSKATVDIHASNRFLHFVYGKVLARGEKFSEAFKVLNSDFHVTFDVFDHGTDHCEVGGFHYELDHVGKVISYSSNPKYNNKISTMFFERNLIPMYNMFAAKKLQGIERVLKQFACNPDLQPDDATLHAIAKSINMHMRNN